MGEVLSHMDIQITHFFSVCLPLGELTTSFPIYRILGEMFLPFVFSREYCDIEMWQKCHFKQPQQSEEAPCCKESKAFHIRIIDCMGVLHSSSFGRGWGQIPVHHILSVISCFYHVWSFSFFFFLQFSLPKSSQVDMTVELCPCINISCHIAFYFNWWPSFKSLRSSPKVNYCYFVHNYSKFCFSKDSVVCKRSPCQIYLCLSP